jgi:pilus assembly protein CpaB
MLLIGVAALVMALILAFLVWKRLGPANAPAREIVVVGVEKIPAGSVLKAQNLKIMPWYVSDLIKGSFKDLKQLENRVTMVEMFQNDLVLDSKLVPKEGGVGGLTAVIDKDKRAVSVKVDSVIGVAGFVLPGTFVDVIVTGQPKSDADLTSKMIIENVKVLTRDQTLEKDPKGEAKISQVVTLLLDPEQAQKIALALTDSHIQLALRNPQDSGINNPPSITKPQLFAGIAPIKVIKKTGGGKTPAPIKQPVVEQPVVEKPVVKRDPDRGFLMISGGKEQKLTLDEWQLGANCSTTGRKQ